MIGAPILTVCLCAFSQAASGGGEEKLAPHADRLRVRPVVPADPQEGQGGRADPTTLVGTPAANDAIKAMLGDPMLSAHARELADWIQKNSDTLEQLAKDSPLYDDLIVRDPALYNVVTLILSASLSRRAEDRAFVSALLAKRSDPAYSEWVDSYTRRLIEKIEEDKTPASTVAGLGDVDHKDVVRDRLGRADDDLLEAAAELAGVADEDKDLVRKLAGGVRLEDGREGKISVETEASGLRDHLDEKLKSIKQSLTQAVEQAAPGSNQKVTVELSAEDRIPEETIPTTSQLGELHAMRKADGEFHVTALAREYARYATRVAYERARRALDRMAAAAGGRAAVAFGILLSHLEAQRTEMETLSAAASPAAAQLRSALAAASQRRLADLESVQSARALSMHRREKSTQPEEFGGFRRAGVDEKGEAQRDYTPGDHFTGEAGGGRRLQTPMDRRLDRGAGGFSADEDPVSRSGRRSWGGGGGGIRLVCRMKDGKFVCELEIPGQGSIPLGD